MHTINLTPSINKVKKVLSNDKKKEIRRSYYLWDYKLSRVDSFSSNIELQLIIERYAEQDVHFNRLIKVPEEILQIMGVKAAYIHVFRDVDPNAVLTEYCNQGKFQMDYCALTFRYWPVRCEITIIEVEF